MSRRPALLLWHRTLLRCRDQPFAEETLQVLFACALPAQSKSDLQQVSIIGVPNAAKRTAVAGSTERRRPGQFQCNVLPLSKPSAKMSWAGAR
jgi:hypothetical protein